MIIRENDDSELFRSVTESNLLRQYDLMLNCMEIGLARGIDAFDKYVLWSLNAVAVANIAAMGGRFRKQPIYVGHHKPPHFREVEEEMDIFFSIIKENWDLWENAVEPAAFALWRLNYIHPFVEGNGRTARAACYLLMCMKAGQILPGKRTVPERIRDNRTPYYAALRAADVAWEYGDLDVSKLTEYLDGLLQQQLEDA